MSTVFLNCTIIGSNALNPIFPMEVRSTEPLGMLSRAIWLTNRISPNPPNPCHLILYTPKQPISTATEDDFDNVIAQLHLDTPEGRASALTRLNPTYMLADYGLSDPVVKTLHILVYHENTAANLVPSGQEVVPSYQEFVTFELKTLSLYDCPTMLTLTANHILAATSVQLPKSVLAFQATLRKRRAILCEASMQRMRVHLPDTFDQFFLPGPCIR
ncbi:hypothetical protein JB92DRAFT_730157 [Gautieria morchelliformis]|nr:hypothetical protein JB92DRAFT_730157 [Gautieria morchelliformis]